MSLRVLVATPLGFRGFGGIDRLNDAIFEELENRTDLDICVTRLVTRGRSNLLVAQFVFAYALVRFSLGAALGRYDLLHIHLSVRGSSYRKAILGSFARAFGIPYVIHLHGEGFDHFWASASNTVARAVERLLNGSNAIIVLGNFWGQVITGRLPNVAHKIRILPNATPRPRYPQQPGASDVVRISFLGKLGARKGTPQLVQALAHLRNRPDWIATLAGDGDVLMTRNQLQLLGISDRVQVPGWLNEGATEALLCQTDILVLPSFSENLPMVIVEAFAHGIAVIATPVGAIPEVVTDGRNGVLVPVGDIGTLATALQRLIEDPELRFRLGQTAQADHARHYEIRSYVTRLVSIWRDSIPSAHLKPSDCQTLRG
jgi:glycosyltransferase involved in cell wall biosynthesis